MKHLIVIATLLVVPAVAVADEAGDHVSKATRFYDVQEWQKALDEYKQAYALDPKPETLWAIAQTQRQSGDCRGAILSYKAYARSASSTGANVAQELIQKCQADLEAQQHAIDAAGAAPPAKPTPATQVAPPAPPSTRPKPRPWSHDPLGVTLLVAGVGGVVGGGALFTLGTLDMRATADKPTAGAYHDAADRAQTKQTIGAAVSIGGAVFTTLAIWRFVSVRHTSTEHVPNIAVSPLPGGAFASYGVRF